MTVCLKSFVSTSCIANVLKNSFIYIKDKMILAKLSPACYIKSLISNPTYLHPEFRLERGIHFLYK